MAPKFGTSGLRGLVTELTGPLCTAYARAFLADAETDGTVLIGRDLRASSPQIAAWIAGAAEQEGLDPIDCGVLPTPALALAAMTRGTAAIMITGSHIPDDRNGLKFYTRTGEITKDDETRITTRVAASTSPVATLGDPRPDDTALAAYCARYTDFFPPDALKGLRIGVYEHSSAAREILGPILAALGAETRALGRADQFVPVDTEALDSTTRDRLSGWAAEHGLDAIVSTDGDADRPMVADGAGRIVPGDILGPLTARTIGASSLVTPISSNGLVDQMPEFHVIRTRIGSPYVIAGMESAPGRAAGYEANGGFLTGFDAVTDGRTLPALPTRDALLPIIAPLALARASGMSLADLVGTLPPVFTATDRLVGVPTEVSQRFVASLGEDTDLATSVFAECGARRGTDLTDGHRAAFEGDRILHLRPSGNAPELRIYTEARSKAEAEEMLEAAMSRVAALIAEKS